MGERNDIGEFQVNSSARFRRIPSFTTTLSGAAMRRFSSHRIVSVAKEKMKQPSIVYVE